VCTETDVPPTEDPASKALQELAALAAAANLGDAAALKDLRRALEAHPNVWREAGDLAAHVEATWLRLAAGGNALAEESIRLEADRIRTELLGTSPTAIEELLVDQIIACWLQLKQAEICAGSNRPRSLMQGRFHDQRLERAQRRYFAAMKMLARVRGLPLSALIPAKLPDSVQTADAPKTESELLLGPLLNMLEAADGMPLRILPESRAAV
jgi:hypothetical protein